MGKCESCKTLAGRPVSVEPHAQLIFRSSIMRGSSAVERYYCRTCGTRWNRPFKEPEGKWQSFE